MSIVVLCVVGTLVAGSLFAIASAITTASMQVANAIEKLAHQVHVHAEVMSEIKHQGIGCDDKQTHVYEYRAV